jgi:hypothetical protein
MKSSDTKGGKASFLMMIDVNYKVLFLRSRYCSTDVLFCKLYSYHFALNHFDVAMLLCEVLILVYRSFNPNGQNS